MTQSGADIAVDQPTAQQTYTGAQEAIRTHRDAIPAPDHLGLDDPTISKALHDHNDKTKGNIDAADDTLETGKDAAGGLADTDASNADRVKHNDGPGGIAALRDALARADGPASPFAAAPTAATPMPAPMPSMPAPAPMPSIPMPAMPAPMAPPPGLVNIAPAALAKLLANATPSSEAHTAAAAGRPAGGAQPLRLDQVIYHPTGETLTRPQVSTLIDRCLDNNGISTDPTVRAHWHDILTNQWFHESSFDPNAINHSRSNTGPLLSDGFPADAARGIAQTKPPTFAAHHVGGTSNNIFDPEADGSAGVAYMMAEYHVSADGRGLEAFHQRRAAAGYGAY